MGRRNFEISNKKFFLKTSGGLSVIKDLAIISIIGFLLVLIFIFYNPITQVAKIKDLKRESDLKNLSVALEDYITDNPCYPEASVISGPCGNENLKPYLNSMPCDPDTKEPYKYDRPGPVCNKFVLYANMKARNLNLSYNGKGNYAVTSLNYKLIPTILGGSEGSSSGGINSPAPGSEYWGCFSGECRQMETRACSPNWRDAMGESKCSESCVDKETGQSINECH